MLWLFVIAMVGGLLYVMFHKPAVNTVVSFTPPPAPPDPRSAETQPSMTAIPVDPDDAPTSAFVPVPLDFNDIFGGRKPPTDRPQV